VDLGSGNICKDEKSGLAIMYIFNNEINTDLLLLLNTVLGSSL
jgi:hypothetical protein